MSDYTEKLDKLDKLDNSKLIDIVKNYRQYGYDKEIRSIALTLLDERGIDKKQLQLTGNFKNNTYSLVLKLYKRFRETSKIAFILFVILLLINILESVAFISSEFYYTLIFILNIFLLISYLFFLTRSFILHNQFYKKIDQTYMSSNILFYILIGMPLYIFVYFYLRNQMKEKIKEIR